MRRTRHADRRSSGGLRGSEVRAGDVACGSLRRGRTGPSGLSRRCRGKVPMCRQLGGPLQGGDMPNAGWRPLGESAESVAREHGAKQGGHRRVFVTEGVT
jgi:hypothetical protein